MRPAVAETAAERLWERDWRSAVCAFGMFASELVVVEPGKS